MSNLQSSIPRLRQDAEYFRAVVRFTAQVTEFAPRLIEKDCLCTVLLEYLSQTDNALVFKGGTCLAKVHADFYRLSEDLDFVIPTAVDSPRAARRREAAAIAKLIDGLPYHLPFFRVVQPLRGANNSTQYNAVIGYAPLVEHQNDTIKIEVALREPLLLGPIRGTAQTILRDPVSGSPLIPPLAVNCISKMEAFAEKFRAALSRREVAVRDFFDLDYAVQRLGIRPEDADLMELVRTKVVMPGNEPVNISANRLATLRRQVESEIRPVLRMDDYSKFDIERAIKLVVAMSSSLHLFRK